MTNGIVTPSAPLGAPPPARPEQWTDEGEFKLPGVPLAAKRFRRRVHDGTLLVIITREPHGIGDWRWHLSISHQRRNPTWEEISGARYDLLPDAITCAMYLPPRAEYVNVHPYCFHLTECGEGA